MKNVMSSLKSGDWRALVACFLYFDTGFTVWVLYGPLAPFISSSVGPLFIKIMSAFEKLP